MNEISNQLRHLQIFRNDVPIEGKTLTEIKALVENASLTLKDGEPISIRYVDITTKEVKCINGIAYVTENGTKKETKILWNEQPNIIFQPDKDSDSFISLVETTDDNGIKTVTASLKVTSINEATEKQNGIASAWDIKQYVDAQVDLQRDQYVKNGKVGYLGNDTNGKKPGEEGYIETEGDTPYLILTVDHGYQILQKSYYVNDETSFENLLPKSYRDDHPWNAAGSNTQETLPWLVVEFKKTPANKLNIKVNAPDGYSKLITYPEIENEVSLLTLEKEEVGHDITNGLWTIEINGNVTTIEVGSEPEVLEYKDTILYIEVSNILPKESTVSLEGNKLTGTEGYLSEKSLETIMVYIDNYDCGTFNLTDSSEQ